MCCFSGPWLVSVRGLVSAAVLDRLRLAYSRHSHSSVVLSIRACFARDCLCVYRSVFYLLVYGECVRVRA